MIVIGVKNERTEPNQGGGPPLKEGQVWTLTDKCLEIKRVGKYLVEFLITQKESHAPGQEHIKKGKGLESIEVVKRFLQNQQAVLSHQ